MLIMKVTPVRNVLIGKRAFKSDRADMFFYKVINENATIDVYDVNERMQKAVSVNEISKRNHRALINNKRFFICSINAG